MDRRIVLFIAVTVVCCLFGAPHSVRSRTLQAIGENRNVELLQELNHNWTLPSDYSLEIVEVNGITMEWVQAVDTKPGKVILQLHGGAYTRSLKDNGTTYRRAAVKYAEISGAAVLLSFRWLTKSLPSALEDAVLAYQWLPIRDAQNIILVILQRRLSDHLSGSRCRCTVAMSPGQILSKP